ncbi:regulatory protein MarR [Methanobacterium lacus]|uniref:Regulatory protein MarR n=1 Tax=Methanobacterium lacus (strain AL-21) TaxID=877455 RepID=F0T858_METLA|nr:regulatory protein MarR [Methanobacterium lacus]
MNCYGIGLIRLKEFFGGSVNLDEKNRVFEEIMGDTIVYVTLFKRELNQLNEQKFMKTLLWLTLIDEYGSPSISNLGRKINVSKSQMTSRVDQLVEDGLIERINDTEDRRIIRIQLTKNGKNFLKDSKKNIEAEMNELIAPLSVEDIEDLKTSVLTIKKIVLKIQQSKKKLC